MTITLAQKNSGMNSAAGATFSSSLPASVTSGNFVIGALTWGNITSTVTISDDKGNIYSASDTVQDTLNAQSWQVFYLNNITNSPSVLTASFGGASPSLRGLSLHEYSGISSAADPRDGHAGQFLTTTSTAANAITSGNVTTTTDGDLIFAAVMADTGDLATAGTNFTLRISDNQGGFNASMTTEDMIQSAHGLVAGTFTTAQSSVQWTPVVVAVKAAAGVTTTLISGMASMSSIRQTISMVGT